MLASNKNTKQIKLALKQNGYFNATKLCNTLQGSIWSSTKPDTKQSVIIKVTNKTLSKTGIICVNGKRYYAQENIFKERAILKYLTAKKHSPSGIVKYIDWFSDQNWYFLVMENGGSSLFDFTQKVHEYIKIGKIEISQWHKVVKVIFKQMVDTLDYMHQKNVAHFDISLENMLINDIDVIIDQNDKLQFVFDNESNLIQMKMCDLGLSEIFDTDTNGQCSFNSSKYAGKHNYESPEIIAKQSKFAANKNDIWSLGVCLFMLIIGGQPFERATMIDKSFVAVMNGKIKEVICHWDRSSYINDEIIDLLSSIFKYENERISITELKHHSFLQ